MSPTSSPNVPLPSLIKSLVPLFRRAVLSGLMICMACVIFLSIPDKIIGAGMFSLGLLVVVVLGLPLFTGKIGYLFHDREITVLQMCVIWLGNLLGAIIMARIAGCTMQHDIFAERVNSLVKTTLPTSNVKTFFAAVMCGIFMYIAVESWKLSQKTAPGAIIVILCVMGFILTGSLHSIAWMGYIELSDATRFLSSPFSGRPLGFILLVTFGNAFGSQLASFLELAFPAAKK